MAKRIVESPQAMKALVGQELGVSDWLVMTQERINKFAEASGDHQWIHVDVERCKTDMPDGKTIAHGNLTFSVISTFGKDVLKIENVRNGINYGSNKVRYTSPVQVGARIRGRQKLLAADDMKDGGIRMTYQWTVEIEGKERPACVAETMSIAYAKTEANRATKRSICFGHTLYRRAIPRILIAAAAAPKPLSMFIAMTPGAQLDSAAFRATPPPEATP